jgi:hypothetical protein
MSIGMVLRLHSGLAARHWSFGPVDNPIRHRRSVDNLPNGPG